MSNRDRSLLKTAIKLASKSDCNQRHGAIVYKGGRILATGFNSYRNAPEMFPNDNIDLKDISVHAEIAAIRKVSASDLEGSVVYIARKGRCSIHMLSKPCNACYEALVAAGVKRIVYTD